MSRKLAKPTAEAVATTKESKLTAYIYIAVLAIIGLLIFIFGLAYVEPNQADPENDALFMGLIFTIPGLVCFLDSFFYLQNSKYRTNAQFVGRNFLLMLLGMISMNTIFFIYKTATDTHGTVYKNGKGLLVIIAIALFYSLLSLIPAGFYRMITWRRR